MVYDYEGVIFLDPWLLRGSQPSKMNLVNNRRYNVQYYGTQYYYANILSSLAMRYKIFLFRKPSFSVVQWVDFKSLLDAEFGECYISPTIWSEINYEHISTRIGSMSNSFAKSMNTSLPYLVVDTAFDDSIVELIRQDRVQKRRNAGIVVDPVKGIDDATFSFMMKLGDIDEQTWKSITSSNRNVSNKAQTS